MSATRIGTMVVLMLGVVVVAAQGGSAEEQAHQQHVVMTPGDIKWEHGPPSLPAGAQFATIEGDPKQEGLFTMRLKVPANYRIPPHWHPADEHVTVLSGTLHMGAGDVLDTSKSTALPAGGFALMPARMHHFAWSSEETIIQLHGVGPWAINYLNPADDPRKQPSN